MSALRSTSHRIVTCDGASSAVLDAIRAEFPPAGFRVVEFTPGERLRLGTGGFWRGWTANLVPVELVRPMRLWGADAVVDAVRLDDSRVELSARLLMPRALVVPVYEQALASVGERLRSAGLTVEIGPELET